MPYKNINGTKIYYEIHGMGPEPMVFCHGLFFSGQVFRDQVDYFKARYKCVIFDFRGQGQSEVTESGYEFDSLAEDIVLLIKELGLGPSHMVGHSTGGAVALRIACRHRELLKSLIVIDTIANNEPSKLRFNLIKATIQAVGIQAVSKKLMKLLFGQGFLTDENRHTDVVFWREQLNSNRKSITKSFSAYINREEVLSELGNIPMPTLIVVGDEDAFALPENSKNIKLKIPQARLASIKGSGHCSIIEEPWQVIETIEVFLNGVH